MGSSQSTPTTTNMKQNIQASIKRMPLPQDATSISDFATTTGGSTDSVSPINMKDLEAMKNINFSETSSAIFSVKQSGGSSIIPRRQRYNNVDISFAFKNETQTGGVIESISSDIANVKSLRNALHQHGGGCGCAGEEDGVLSSTSNQPINYAQLKGGFKTDMNSMSSTSSQFIDYNVLKGGNLSATSEMTTENKDEEKNKSKKDKKKDDSEDSEDSDEEITDEDMEDDDNEFGESESNSDGMSRQKRETTSTGDSSSSSSTETDSEKSSSDEEDSSTTSSEDTKAYIKRGGDSSEYNIKAVPFYSSEASASYLKKLSKSKY